VFEVDNVFFWEEGVFAVGDFDAVEVLGITCGNAREGRFRWSTESTGQRGEHVDELHRAIQSHILIDVDASID